jgi:hypothetical protein
LLVLCYLFFNHCNAPFRNHIQKWAQDISNTNELVELVQNMWVYFESNCVGGYIFCKVDFPVII